MDTFRLTIPNSRSRPNSVEEKRETREITLYTLSDIHSEFCDFNLFPVLKRITQDADIAILPGDIGNITQNEEEYTEVISYFSEKYENVIVIAGNHEYFGCGGDLEKVRRKIWEICENFGNVHFLDRSSIVLHGIKFIGVTLWTLEDVKPRDYPRPNRIFKNYLDSVIEFAKDVEYLATEVTSARNGESRESTRQVVITHHQAFERHYYYQNIGEDEDLSGVFTNLGGKVDLSGVDLWISGHTHQNNLIVEGRTTFLEQQLGDDLRIIDEDKLKYVHKITSTLI